MQIYARTHKHKYSWGFIVNMVYHSIATQTTHIYIYRLLEKKTALHSLIVCLKEVKLWLSIFFNSDKQRSLFLIPLQLLKKNAGHKIQPCVSHV